MGNWDISSPAFPTSEFFKMLVGYMRKTFSRVEIFGNGLMNTNRFLYCGSLSPEPLFGFWNPPNNPRSMSKVLEAALHQWWHELVGKCSSCSTLCLGYLGGGSIPSPKVPPLESWAPNKHRVVYFISFFFLLLVSFFFLLSSIFPSTSQFAIPLWRLPKELSQVSCFQGTLCLRLCFGESLA